MVLSPGTALPGLWPSLEGFFHAHAAHKPTARRRSSQGLVEGEIAKDHSRGIGTAGAKTRAGQAKTPVLAKQGTGHQCTKNMHSRCRKLAKATRLLSQEGLLASGSPSRRTFPFRSPGLRLPGYQNSGSCDGRHRLQRRVRGRFSRPSLIPLFCGRSCNVHESNGGRDPCQAIRGQIPFLFRRRPAPAGFDARSNEDITSAIACDLAGTASANQRFPPRAPPSV